MSAPSSVPYTQDLADGPQTISTESITLLGVLHCEPASIAHLCQLVTESPPDIIAVEAEKEVINHYHPDNTDPRWPPQHEIEAAAYIVVHNNNMALAGIDTTTSDANAIGLQHLDERIFKQIGILAPDEPLTPDVYYRLTKPAIRDWRDMTKTNRPQAYAELLTKREDTMAAHLQTIATHDTINHIVAAVGLQHLTGVADKLDSYSATSEGTTATGSPPIMHGVTSPAP